MKAWAFRVSANSTRASTLSLNEWSVLPGGWIPLDRLSTTMVGSTQTSQTFALFMITRRPQPGLSNAIGKLRKLANSHRRYGSEASRCLRVVRNIAANRSSCPKWVVSSPYPKTYHQKNATCFISFRSEEHTSEL